MGLSTWRRYTLVVCLPQARDRLDKERVSGQDEWDIQVTNTTDGTEVGVNVVDEHNGRYLVSYTAPAPGTYKVSVRVILR